MDTQTNQRRNYFIDKKFQSRFILRFCSLVVLASVISGVILYSLSRGTVTTAFVNSRLSIVSTAHYIVPSLIVSSLVAIILIGIATAAVLMYLSHRIAGPLFNIQRSVREIGGGNLNQKIKLRSNDEMVKLADCFNEMTENLKIHLSGIKAKSDDLGEAINNLKNKASSSKQIQEELGKLSRQKEELDKAIDYFKV